MEEVVTAVAVVDMEVIRTTEVLHKFFDSALRYAFIGTFTNQTMPGNDDTKNNSKAAPLLKGSGGAYVPPALRKLATQQSDPKVDAGSSRFKNLDLSTPSDNRSRDYRQRSGFSSKGGVGKYRSTVPDAKLEIELFGNPEQETVAAGINFDAYDNIPVEVNGSNPPKAATDFSDLELEERVSKNVRLCRYTKPTPIQKYAIPTACDMRDLMACAQTGSGKTAAFLLPVINSMLRHNERTQQSQGSRYSQKHSPLTLVLAPTRELATQIYEESQKFLYCTGLRSVVVYGGQDARIQLRDLEKGCELLVATPGRLMDLIDRGRISMGSIRHLIFDEADRMLDMGFEPQIRSIVEECDMPRSIGSYEDPTRGRQTLMFSATFPREIQALASDFLHDYIFVTVGRLGSTNEFIIQKLEYCEDNEKRSTLMRLLPECQGLTVIFVETKRNADALEMFLNDTGVNAISIHGDRTQMEREYALAQFKAGRTPVLVATDVAARGLDIDNVLHVVNYDLPNSIDDYVHRIGRTGRRGNTGTAHSFVNEKNQSITKDLYGLLKESNQEVPSWFEEMCAYASRQSSRRGGKRGGSSRFGAKDVRKQDGGGKWRTSKEPGGAQGSKKPQSSQPSRSGDSWSNFNQKGFGGSSRDAW